MSKKCKTCGGRGRWQVHEVYSDGDDCYVWYTCNDCNATGIEPDPEAGEDFDISGSSLPGGDDDD